jgi:hypothetical protein
MQIRNGVTISCQARLLATNKTFSIVCVKEVVKSCQRMVTPSFFGHYDRPACIPLLVVRYEWLLLTHNTLSTFWIPTRTYITWLSCSPPELIHLTFWTDSRSTSLNCCLCLWHWRCFRQATSFQLSKNVHNFRGRFFAMPRKWVSCRRRAHGWRSGAIEIQHRINTEEAC